MSSMLGQAAARPNVRRAFALPLDPLLTFAVLALAGFSLMTLNGATSHDVPGSPGYYVDRQAIYFAVGIVAMLVLSRIDYSRLREFKYIIYGLLIVSILGVMVLGHSAGGAQREISLPLFNFQASELGKVLLILALPAFIVDRSRKLSERDTTAAVMAAALVPAMIVIAQPDLGSGLVYISIGVMMLFVVGTSWKHLAALAALGAIALTLVLAAFPAAGVHVIKPFQLQRLTAFLHPSDDPNNVGYQQNQSKIAIGSGEKTGRGVNASETRDHFLPEHGTDFVFASVGEQYGFVGAALVLALYALIIWRALRILTMAKNLFGSLVAGGILAMFMFQVFVNAGMTVGIMPITGVTLPLMSYGGSSVLATLLAVGLLQSIYVQARAAAASKSRVLRF
jgi:rod shape determining protein RodA